MGVQALWLTALVPVLFIGARLRGITGVSIGHVAVAALLVGPAFLWALSKSGITVRSIFRACLRPFLGGALMAVVSLAVIHYLGEGLVGLAAAIVAALAVYAPIVYPMRKLIRQAPPEDEPTTRRASRIGRKAQGRHRRPDAPKRQRPDQSWGPMLMVRPRACPHPGRFGEVATWAARRAAQAHRTGPKGTGTPMTTVTAGACRQPRARVQAAVTAPGPADGQQDRDGADAIIVLRAANNYSGPRFADQQLAEALAAMHPVLYVDPASSVVSRRRHPELRDAYAEPKLRPIAPNLTRLSPSALPGMERPGMAAVTSALTARAIRHSARQLGARRWPDRYVPAGAGDGPVRRVAERLLGAGRLRRAGGAAGPVPAAHGRR